MASSPFTEVQPGYASSLPASVFQKAQLLADLKGMEGMNFRERIQAHFHHSRQKSALLHVQGRLRFSLGHWQPLCVGVSLQSVPWGQSLWTCRFLFYGSGFSFYTKSNFSYLLSSELTVQQGCNALGYVIDDQKKKGGAVHTYIPLGGWPGRGGHVYALACVVSVSGAALLWHLPGKDLRAGKVRPSCRLVAYWAPLGACGGGPDCSHSAYMQVPPCMSCSRRPSLPRCGATWDRMQDCHCD